MLAYSLKIVGTIGYYALFTDNFVENFCENKDKPSLNCNGKCALSKMLNQASETEQAPLNLDWLKSETVLFVPSLAAMVFLKSSHLKSDNFQYFNLYSFKFTQRLIHPPQI